ncbi:FMN-dependent NADH-azoreductase [Sphingomonas sp. LaA6.9]|uniref:FMN-dependent NADH-azoreductase n=1 Tax=Sphingomonas sp. LaA6.9 TaxID=2919914 RepID=UPI001F4F46F8|nr:NAD(P)H-dependent oxidoreductase [Sphingomonas sp. LaA6.9]MCJ8159105.1 NAD(P)H-dependent oxidoreductase [Sphingomonas sp. LaA6.9]
MNLLHIDSSIQADGSASRMISAAAVERLKAAHPDINVTYRDLAAEPLAHITLEGLSSAHAQGVLDEFLNADIVVIGVPMYNFGIPSQLKAWIDHIAIAGKTFSYGPEGVMGLAGGKRVTVALSRGGLYGEGSPAASIEHAETYLKAVLGFIGLGDAEFIVAEGLALGSEQREAALAGAFAQLDERLLQPAG